MKSFRIISVNVSDKTGVSKRPVSSVSLKEDYGIVGDAHAGNHCRQVSLLAQEDIISMQAKGFELKPGDFAENITTQGIDLSSLPIGAKIKIGDCLMEVTQIGKQCHKGCAIREQVGDCVMPRKGIFAKVIIDGEISNESIGTYDF